MFKLFVFANGGQAHSRLPVAILTLVVVWSQLPVASAVAAGRNSAPWSSRVAELYEKTVHSLPTSDLACVTWDIVPTTARRPARIFVLNKSGAARARKVARSLGMADKTSVRIVSRDQTRERVLNLIWDLTVSMPLHSPSYVSVGVEGNGSGSGIAAPQCPRVVLTLFSTPNYPASDNLTMWARSAVSSYGSKRLVLNETTFPTDEIPIAG